MKGRSNKVHKYTSFIIDTKCTITMVLVKFEKYYSVYYQSIRNIKSFTEECYKQKLLVVDDDV